MKYSYKEMPEQMKGTFGDFSRNFGFSWKEFVVTVPSPLFLVTTYKANGQPNACMQSWATFTSADHGNGFYAILASVNKNGHLYASISETKEAVINFMSAEYHAACMSTIKNNQYEEDEITASGLTVEKASWVNAPMVQECFMNLECKLKWEKEIVPSDDHAMLCLEVIGLHIDENNLPDRTGESGILYNIHYQVNPENVGKTAHDYAGVLQKKIDVMEY
ncbi:MAG: flavin reductase family protein [Lachnospiraceae bacterium]|nr:flavin reductase family protein [Lachnospiraceae bacterium]